MSISVPYPLSRSWTRAATRIRTIWKSEARPEPGQGKLGSCLAGMNGEIEAPPPNAGVRITAGASRPHLEAAHIGTVFHALMENLSDDLSLPSEEVLESVAFSHGDVVADALFRTELLNEARSLVATFFESDLYLQLKSARRRFNEVPYVLASMPAYSHDQLGIFDDFDSRSRSSNQASRFDLRGSSGAVACGRLQNRPHLSK